MTRENELHSLLHAIMRMNDDDDEKKKENEGSDDDDNCTRRDFAQKAKSRGGTLVTRAYIKESTYS